MKLNICLNSFTQSNCGRAAQSAFYQRHRLGKNVLRDKISRFFVSLDNLFGRLMIFVFAVQQGQIRGVKGRNTPFSYTAVIVSLIFCLRIYHSRNHLANETEVRQVK